MKAAGIKLMIVSNNHAPRVKPFAEQLELDFVPEGKKTADLWIYQSYS